MGCICKSNHRGAAAADGRAEGAGFLRRFHDVFAAWDEADAVRDVDVIRKTAREVRRIFCEKRREQKRHGADIVHGIRAAVSRRQDGARFFRHDFAIGNGDDSFPIVRDGNFDGGADAILHHGYDEAAQKRRCHIVRMPFDARRNLQHFILRKRRAQECIRENDTGNNRSRRAAKSSGKRNAIHGVHPPGGKRFPYHFRRFFHGAENNILRRRRQRREAFAFRRHGDIRKISVFRDKMQFIFERERKTQDVETAAQIRGRRRDAHDDFICFHWRAPVSHSQSRRPQTNPSAPR